MTQTQWMGMRCHQIAKLFQGFPFEITFIRERKKYIFLKAEDLLFDCLLVLLQITNEKLSSHSKNHRLEPFPVNCNLPCAN